MPDIEQDDGSRKQAWVVSSAARADIQKDTLELVGGDDPAIDGAEDRARRAAEAAVRHAAEVSPATVPKDWNLKGIALDPAAIEMKRSWRKRGHTVPWDALPDSASTMFETPELEQLVGTNNLVPAYWLEDGAARARTVCKVDASGVDYVGRRGSWSGTGFLVAPNILCTNHHVVNSTEVAGKSRALFDFAANSEGGVRQTTVFRLRPDLLFWTSPTIAQGGLDATFVALDGPAGQTFGHNQLLRQSFSVANTDKLNIIQHPRGRLKEVAMRDNTVVFQDGRVVHYESDTEAGSSGAAVYNDAWELVALHHASVPGGKANEGIKFSALASAIEQDAQRGDDSARQLLRLFRGTDELMGFFGGVGRRVDLAGGGLERVQDAYLGEAQDLDIGFWNVEWFNKRWQDKLDAVARVIVEMNLDVWVLVESSEEATQALANHLTANYTGHWGVLASQEAPSEQQITTVLWNTKTAKVSQKAWPDTVLRWFAVDSRAFDDLGLEAVHGKVFDRFPARYEVSAQLDGRDVMLNLVPVHLKAMAEGSLRRQMASRLLAEAVAETTRVEGASGDWVIGGDFNATLGSGDFDALTRAGLTPISATDAEQQQFTYVKDPYKSLIDHIFVSPNLVAQTRDEFVIVALDRSLDRFLDISDHRPILVRLAAAASAQKKADSAGAALTADETTRVLSGLTRPRRAPGDGALDDVRRRAEDTSVYYDAAADAVLRAHYWAGVAPGGSEFLAALRALLVKTHVKPLRYAPSTHLYPWVDVHPDGLLRSIYSGEQATPESYIRHDAAMDLERESRLESLRAEGASLETEQLEALLEAEFQHNCEHVVPQSWFSKQEPMRGDLHHLFACETRCNSFRSNHAYTTFTLEKTLEDCGRMEDGQFEPNGGKGPVARATLYFLLRYKGAIAGRYSGEALENLLRWHRENPPDEWERHRNLAIHQAQGNRNPLIDFPEWAERLFARP